MAKRKPLIPLKVRKAINSHLIAASIGLTVGVWGTLAARPDPQPMITIPANLTTGLQR